MEKLYYSNRNLGVFNHLPRILNMMQILNMMVHGFVSGQPAYVISAVSSLQKSIQLPRQRQLRKKLVLRLRNIYYAMITTGLLSVLLLNSATVNLLFIFSSLALLCPGTEYYIINKPHTRISRFLYLRNSHRQKALLKDYPDGWFYYYQRYRITDLLSICCLLSAALAG